MVNWRRAVIAAIIVTLDLCGFLIRFQLGPVTDHHQWQDYLLYGFSAADAPELLSLVSDESLHGADTNSNELWMSPHAWPTLGQLPAGH